MASVALVSAIPQDDLPETTYNESDAPLNQALPAVPVAVFARPLVSTTISARVTEAAARVRPRFANRERARRLFAGRPHSRQDLLCTFLI